MLAVACLAIQPKIAALADEAAAPASNQQQVLVQWKLAPGERLGYLRTQDRTTVSTVGGRQVESRIVRETWLTLRVEKTDSDGPMRVEQSIDRVRLRRQLPGETVEYDSAAGDTEGGVAAFAGITFTFRLAPSGEISDVQLTKATEARIRDEPAEIREIMTPATLRHLIPIQIVPEQPITPGDQWEQRTTFTDAIIGTRHMVTTYTYRGLEEFEGNQFLRFDLEMNVEVEPAANSPIAVQAPQLRTTGRVLFDHGAGRLELIEIDESGTMRTQFNGRSVDNKITGKVTWKRLNQRATPADRPRAASPEDER